MTAFIALHVHYKSKLLCFCIIGNAYPKTSFIVIVTVYEHIPIIAMTANAFTEDIQDALRAGVNAHVAKPVDMAVLEQTVRTVMGKG